MSRSLRESTPVGVGAHAICVRRPDGSLLHRPMASTSAMNDADRARRFVDSLEAIETELGSKLPVARRFVVADGLVRYWMMSAPAGVSSLRELKTVAEARSRQLFGAAHAWHVAADWAVGRPFLCAALPGWLVAGAQAHGGDGVQMDAMLARLLSSGRPGVGIDAGWICVTLPGCTNLLGVVQGRVVSVRSVPTKATSDVHALLAGAALELQRESLRTQIELTAPVQWHCLVPGAAPASNAGAAEVDGIQFSLALSLGGPGSTHTFREDMADAEAAASLDMALHREAKP